MNATGSSVDSHSIDTVTICLIRENKENSENRENKNIGKLGKKKRENKESLGLWEPEEIEQIGK